MADLVLGESRLKELCKASELSLSKFAQKLGVSRQYVYKITVREKTFSLLQAIKAARILKCNVEDLYDIIE